MKHIILSLVVIISLFVGGSIYAKVQTVRVPEPTFEVGSVGNTIKVFKFIDGDKTCYISQYASKERSSDVDITCVK